MLTFLFSSPCLLADRGVETPEISFFLADDLGVFVQLCSGVDGTETRSEEVEGAGGFTGDLAEEESSTEEVVAEAETSEEEVIAEEEEVEEEINIDEDINALIAGEELSEEFQEKARAHE